MFMVLKMFAPLKLRCDCSYFLLDCGHPGNLTNGNVNITGTGFEDKATYSCDDGYELVGPSERFCLSNDQWTSDAPICNIIGKLYNQLRYRT